MFDVVRRFYPPITDTDIINFLDKRLNGFAEGADSFELFF
jgi:hypothetical protein